MSSEVRTHPTPEGPPGYAVVIPTLGRAGLAELIRTIDATPAPLGLVVVDDRPAPGDPLVLPPTRMPVRLVAGGGHGPAAARNLGWLTAVAEFGQQVGGRREPPEWICFLDDDVVPGADWCARVVADLTGRPAWIGGSQAHIRVPAPPGRPPTDEERLTVGLADAAWITADLAYRRSALLATGGFDERFPRAFREDTDLAVRVRAAGFEIVRGSRVTTHPLTARGGWRSSLRAQAGNADNALLRAKYGLSWRAVCRAGAGRTGRHLVATLGGAAAVALFATGRRRSGAGAAALWLGLTAEFAARRILPGPRTVPEVSTMVLTSVLIPPLALWHRLKGEVRLWRRADRSPTEAVLFDRDGTLIVDVPYLNDPDGVRLMPQAVGVLAGLRRRGVATGIVSNQSGIASRRISEDQLRRVNERVEDLLGPVDVIEVCPHGPDEGCRCRKPGPAMVEAAARELGVAPERCVVVGDIRTDVQAAQAARARGVLVPTPNTSEDDVRWAKRHAVTAVDLEQAVAIALDRPWARSA